MKTDSRFPQILEDKRGLAGGEVVLVLAEQPYLSVIYFLTFSMS